MILGHGFIEGGELLRIFCGIGYGMEFQNHRVERARQRTLGTSEPVAKRIMLRPLP